MPLVTEVGLGLGDIVLDGEPAPPKRGTHPNFEPMSIVAKRLYASGYASVESAANRVETMSVDSTV